MLYLSIAQFLVWSGIALWYLIHRDLQSGMLGLLLMHVSASDMERYAKVKWGHDDA